MRRLSLAAAATSAVLAACGGGDPGAVREPAQTPTAISSLLLQPMDALPPCGSPPPPGDVGEVPGAVLPTGAVVRTAADQGALTQLFGFVPLTPVQMLVDLQERDDITIIVSEHEQFESEVAYETDTHRGFIKAQVACATGSDFVEVIASLGSDAAVPTPSGGAPTTPP